MNPRTIIKNHVLVPMDNQKDIPWYLRWVIRIAGFETLSPSEFQSMSMEASMLGTDVDRMKKLAGTDIPFLGNNKLVGVIDLSEGARYALDNGFVEPDVSDTIEGLVEEHNAAILEKQ